MHRDIKPENCVVSHDGHVKLIDFGFAKILKNDRTYTNCGTVGYTAPEVLAGQQGYSYQADVWSFGIMLCVLLSG